jgi:lysozyme
MTDTPKVTKGRAAAGAGVIGLAALIMSQFTPIWEGRSLTPYQDVVGVWTVCEGETRVEMRTYTAAECNAMSRKMYQEFASYVVEVTPGIADNPFMLAAFADTAINIGKGAYKRSSMRREYMAGNYREACRSLLKYVYAGGRKWRGLELRRKGDAGRMGSYEVCLADAVEAELRDRGVL